MKDQLVSFETAKLAKEKGFNERIRHSYYNFEEGHKLNGEYYEKNYHAGFGYSSNTEDTSISAPTQSILQKWLREVYNIHIMIDPDLENNRYWFNIVTLNKSGIQDDNFYLTYEEALESGLQRALNLI